MLVSGEHESIRPHLSGPVAPLASPASQLGLLEILSRPYVRSHTFVVRPGSGQPGMGVRLAIKSLSLSPILIFAQSPAFQSAKLGANRQLQRQGQSWAEAKSPAVPPQRALFCEVRGRRGNIVQAVELACQAGLPRLACFIRFIHPWSTTSCRRCNRGPSFCVSPKASQRGPDGVCGRLPSLPVDREISRFVVIHSRSAAQSRSFREDGLRRQRQGSRGLGSLQGLRC